jgi:hypothetical protein
MMLHSTQKLEPPANPARFTGLGTGGRRAGAEGGKGGRDLARVAGGDVDVVGLEDTAQVGLVRNARAQALQCGFLVPEGLEELERKLLPVEELLGEFGYGLFDLDSVHGEISVLVRGIT